MNTILVYYRMNNGHFRTYCDNEYKTRAKMPLLKKHRFELMPGFKADDEGLLKIKTGQLNIVTGVPGSGKSEWVDDLMINTIKNHGIKWAVFSPENYPPQVYYKKLAEKYHKVGFSAFTDQDHMEAITGLSDKVKLIVDTDEQDVLLISYLIGLNP